MTTQDFVKDFGAALIILPVIQFIQAVSIAKAFGKVYSYEVDSTQELIALGMSNFVGCFFGGWPVCSSFSRSAVNAMSGTKTPFSGRFGSGFLDLYVLCSGTFTYVNIYQKTNTWFALHTFLTRILMQLKLLSNRSYGHIYSEDPNI